MNRFKDKKVLVIGGMGFIGSNLVRKLYEEGAKVFVLDINPNPCCEGSVTDYDLVEDMVKNSDIVFNMACKNIIESMKDPKTDFEVNVGGMINILMAAKKYGTERIIFPSSVSVYGNSKYLPVNEDEQLVALNPYAASKISAEAFCMAFYESYDVPITILRYSNVYGPGQSPGVVSKFFKMAMDGTGIQLHGDGNQTRDFTYIDDVVEATLLAALSPKAIGEVFNVGTGVETCVKELAFMIADLVPTGIGTIDRRDIDNIRRRVLNIEKIRKTLKWIPTVDLESGLDKTYEWIQNER